MTWDEFVSSMVRLCEYMKAQTMSQEQMREYYGPVVRIGAEDFDGAITRLIETFAPRPGHNFPLVPDIREAIDWVIEHRLRNTAEKTLCRECWGFGAVIVEDGKHGERATQGQETFCACAAGQKRRKARQEYIEKEGRGFRAPRDFQPRATRRQREWMPYKDPPDIPDDIPAIVEHTKKGMESQFKIDAGEEAWNEMLRSAKERLNQEEGGPCQPEDEPPF